MIRSTHEDYSFHLFPPSPLTITTRSVLTKMPGNTGIGARHLEHMLPISKFLAYLESVLSNGSTERLMCTIEEEREFWD